MKIETPEQILKTIQSIKSVFDNCIANGVNTSPDMLNACNATLKDKAVSHRDARLLHLHASRQLHYSKTDIYLLNADLMLALNEQYRYQRLSNWLAESFQLPDLTSYIEKERRSLMSRLSA